VKAFALLVPVAVITYVACWTNWLTTSTGYLRDWAATNPGQGISWLPPGLRSLVAYHVQAWGFHTTLTSDHDYQSNPALWLLQARPTSFFYEHEPTCGSDSCSQAVTALGNPLIWWVGIVALGVVLYQAVIWADRRAWAILCGYLAGYVPWLFFAQRTIFTFYTVAFVPFVVLALAYAAGVLLGPDRRVTPASLTDPEADAVPALYAHAAVGSGPLGRPRISPVPALIVGMALVLMLFVSAFFWPVWTAESVPFQFWQMHMWFQSWI
jgi:dolichyl-phosphate-mannose--protein O-mannosyl transferase